jgi:hypothetical protein
LTTGVTPLWRVDIRWGDWDDDTMTDQTPVPTPDPTPAAPAYAAAPAGPVRPWNVLAIVSLVIAIVGFSWISLGAVITGHIALSQIKKTGEQGHGLALAGTIIGYVGIAATLIWIPIVIFGALAAASYSSY